jgi:hypothetical protein
LKERVRNTSSIIFLSRGNKGRTWDLLDVRPEKGRQHKRRTVNTLRAIQSHLLSEGATIPVPTELICLPFNFDLEFVIYFILKHSSLHRKRLTTK